jgi:hypothetical protein
MLTTIPAGIAAANDARAPSAVCSDATGALTPSWAIVVGTAHELGAGARGGQLRGVDRSAAPYGEHERDALVDDEAGQLGRLVEAACEPAAGDDVEPGGQQPVDDAPRERHRRSLAAGHADARGVEAVGGGQRRRGVE